jgi:hypothetical protein
MGSLLMARVTNPCDAQHHQDTDFTIRMAAFPPLRQKGPLSLANEAMSEAK